MTAQDVITVPQKTKLRVAEFLLLADAGAFQDYARTELSGDSMLDIDLGRKARLYARYGVPEYRVVDVEERVIYRMSRPAGEAYTECPISRSVIGSARRRSWT